MLTECEGEPYNFAAFDSMMQMLKQSNQVYDKVSRPIMIAHVNVSNNNGLPFSKREVSCLATNCAVATQHNYDFLHRMSRIDS